jgi:hypothetical protein
VTGRIGRRTTVFASISHKSSPLNRVCIPG